MNPYSNYDSYPTASHARELREQGRKASWWIAPIVAIPVALLVYGYIAITAWLLIVTVPLLIVVFVVAVSVSFALVSRVVSLLLVG